MGPESTRTAAIPTAAAESAGPGRIPRVGGHRGSTPSGADRIHQEHAMNLHTTVRAGYGVESAASTYSL